MLTILAWLIALSLAGVAIFLGWRYLTQEQPSPSETNPIALAQSVQPQNKGQAVPVSIPSLAQVSQEGEIDRKVLLHTTIPNRPDLKIQTYTVEKGDALFGIAAQFKIKPETILWANYDQLNDNPDMISVGMILNIPPVNGVYYEWKKGDTVQAVAGRFDATVDDILSWPANQADLTNPTFKAGDWVMVPNGHREFRQWLIPVIPRGRAGVSKSVYGAGACEGSYEGAYGSGGFVWPAGNHYLSGNDYWSGHLGIDIAAGEGAPIYAADSGVVVFAGWATGGYGNMIMIDHGNGYQTLYGHLSQVAVSCGRSVGQGQTIGYAGSTGNSTGAHLHFEVRFQGGFVDPWYVLPAP